LQGGHIQDIAERIKRKKKPTAFWPPYWKQGKKQHKRYLANAKRRKNRVVIEYKQKSGARGTVMVDKDRKRGGRGGVKKLVSAPIAEIPGFAMLAKVEGEVGLSRQVGQA